MVELTAMMELDDRLLAVLERHRGRDRCIGMGELFRKVFRLPYTHRINDTGGLRVLVRKLRRRGHPICSSCDKHDPGYYLAESPEELAEFIARYRRRTMTALVQEAAIRRIALPELIGQLSFELAEPVSSEQ